MEKLFDFMLSRHISSSEEVLQAFVEIYKHRHKYLTSILQAEMDRIFDGNARGYDFPHNLMRVLNVLSAVNPKKLGPLISMSPNFYEYHPANHYWCENALRFHYNIAKTNEDLLPEDIAKVVKEFLDGEMRASVRRNGRRFLTEIGEWDESILTEYNEIDEITSTTCEINIEDLDANNDFSEF